MQNCHQSIVIVATMPKRVAALLLLTLVCTSASFRNEIEEGDGEASIFDFFKAARKFDHVVVSQFWPQASYWSANNQWHQVGKECCSCFMPDSKHNWTLHGVWPSSFHGPHPSFCDRKLKYDPKSLQGLKARLEQEWPSFIASSSNERFWHHEWDKHGTCALGLPGMSSQAKFFSGCLDVLNRYNMGGILARSGIVPGDKKYDYANIVAAIKDALGTKGYPQCGFNHLTNEQYLIEVFVCLDKQLQPVDCASEFTRCKKNEKIVYPKILNSC